MKKFNAVYRTKRDRTEKRYMRDIVNGIKDKEYNSKKKFLTNHIIRN